MPTSQDQTSTQRAAHLSSDASESAAGGRARRKATKRTGKRRSSTAASQKDGSSPHMSERTARATKRAAAAHRRRSQGSKPARKRNESRATPFAALLALLAVAAVVGMGFMVVPNLFRRGETKVEEYPAGEQVIVTIPEGASGAQIAKILIEAHVISDESLFFQEVQKQNADAYMKSGTYQFVTGATPSEVVRQLVTGPNATDYQLKLAEGLTVAQTAAAVEDQLGIPADDFIEQAKASNYVADYPFLENVSEEYDTLEGFLYAKTYDFGGTDMSADTVIRTMLNQYQTEVESLDFQSARDTILATYDIDISNYGIIKLASIIEREAITDKDRPLVSSVFYNRMGRDFPGMGYVWPYLQSDATMMYVTGGEVTSTDLQTDSPYNTYLNQNLPPTPICSPSIESIQAALEPENSDYFFFFIKEGYHRFSKTDAEHQQAIAVYQSGDYTPDDEG